MKKLFMLLSVLSLLFLVACSKDDNVFKMAKHPTRIYEDDYKYSSLSQQLGIYTKEIKGSKFEHNKYEILYYGEYSSKKFKFRITKKEIGRYNLYYTSGNKQEVLVSTNQEDEEARKKVVELIKTDVGYRGLR